MEDTRKLILQLFAGGYTSEQIARRIGKSRAAIDCYAAKIIAELGAHSRAHAVAKGIKLGLVDLEAVRD